MPPMPRQSINAIVGRVDQHDQRIEDHDQRIDDLETRLDRYDAIIVRLDTLIDILTRRVEATADKAEDAIEGQGLLKERNESAYRWSSASIALACSLIVGIAMFILGYLVH